MKKFLLPILFLILALSFVFYKNDSFKSSITTTPESQMQESKATLKVNFSESNTRTYAILVEKDDTAFSILKKSLEKENIKIETIQYDFGVFIKKIGDLESTAKKSWIYYVNGESGQVAADKYVIKNNDLIEWKYEVPNI